MLRLIRNVFLLFFVGLVALMLLAPKRDKSEPPPPATIPAVRQPSAVASVERPTPVPADAPDVAGSRPMSDFKIAKLKEQSLADRAGMAVTNPKALAHREKSLARAKTHLSEDVRRRIYAESHRAWMFASFATREKYPESAPITADGFAAEQKFYEAQGKANRAKLILKFKADGDELDAIDMEGLEAGWPLPDVEKPDGKPIYEIFED